MNTVTKETRSPATAPARPADTPVEEAPAAGTVRAAEPREHSRRGNLLRQAGVAVPLAILGLLGLAAVVPALFAPFGPLDIQPTEAFQGPSASHWFGTDESGRDVFSRVIHGTGRSLLIGLAATAIGLGVAGILGFLAGLGGRTVDFAVSRFLEVLFAFPGLLLALVVITVLGPGVLTTTIAVGLSTAPGYARLIRSQVMTVRRSGYVEAAVVQGRSPLFILGRHILPNAAAPLLVLATLGLGQAIVWASALSFLGLGATPPDPEWGSMLSAGRLYIANAWWLTVFPGLFIVLSAAATTILGNSLQRRLQSR